MDQLDPSIHQVITAGELAAWLRREFSDSLVFLFRMRNSKRYGIGEWMGGSEFIEHCAIGPDLRAFDRQMADDLRWNLATTAQQHRRWVINTVQSRQRARERQYDEHLHTMKDMAAHMLRHSKKDSQYLRALAGEL